MWKLKLKKVVASSSRHCSQKEKKKTKPEGEPVQVLTITGAEIEAQKSLITAPPKKQVEPLMPMSLFQFYS